MEKGRGFLVDTKSICFMCFQDKHKNIKTVNTITTDSTGTTLPQSQHKNDTEGVAKKVNTDKFEDIASNNNNNEDLSQVKHDKGSLNTVEIKKINVQSEKDEKISAFSFRVLTRYLKINLQKVFSLNVPFHSRHLLEKTELTVSLCPKCAVIAESFVKLCQELELIQMKIQGCLLKVNEVITKAENDKVLVDNYRKQMITPNPLDLIQAGIVDNLRKEISEKCSRTIQKALPRVRLEKVEVNPKETASSLVPKIDIPALDLTAILTEENYLESIRRSASVIFTSSMKSSQEQGSLSGNLQLETVIAPSLDPNSIDNMDVFNDICEEIEIQSPSMSPPSSSSMQCGDNGVLDPLGDTDPMVFPVEEESSILEKVSSPPTQHEQPEELDENDKNDYVKLCKRIIKGQPRFYCELCNQRVTSRQKHKRVVHREGLLKCAYCQRGFSEYRERKLHTIIQHHFEKYLIPIKPPRMTEEAFKEVTEACFGMVTENRKDYSCPICGKSHRKTPNLRGHVVEHHFDIYKAKLDVLLNINSNSAQPQQNIITYSVALPQNGNNNLNLSLLQFDSESCNEKLPELEAMAEEIKPEDVLDQTFSQDDLNQSLLSDLDFTMNSSQMESSISEESQSPALSQQQSVAEVEKDEDDESSDRKPGKTKYIVITGRKQDGRPLYFCNICKKSVTNTIMHKRIHHGEKLLNCIHCNKEVTTAYILREHTAQFHPTELFKALKNDRCSQEQFEKLVDILIKDLIKKAVELKGPGEKQKCPLCLKECKQKGRWYLHLMDQHLQGLSEQLQEIQKRELGMDIELQPKVKQKVQRVIITKLESPSEKLQQQPKKVSPATPVPVSSTSPATPSQKKQQAQGDKSKGTPTPKGNYSEKHRFICDACGSRFTQSSSLKRHEKLYCKVSKPQEALVLSESKKDVEYHPLLTPSIITPTAQASQEPPTPSPKTDASISKPKPFQPSPSTSSITEGLTTIDTSSLSWSIGSTSGGGNLGCSYCDKTFMFPYCQRTHLITAHRVETFSEHVPIGTSYEEVETVLSIILQDFHKTPTGMNICNFCTKEYAQVSELESHVLISHFDEVVQKLKNLVQLREELIMNPNFGASFDNFNLLNEDCVIDGNEELVANGEGDSAGDVADVQIFDLDQFPELREIYSSLSGGGAGGDNVDLSGGGGEQDGMAMGIEQVINAGNPNNDIAMGDHLFF